MGPFARRRGHRVRPLPHPGRRGLVAALGLARAGLRQPLPRRPRAGNRRGKPLCGPRTGHPLLRAACDLARSQGARRLALFVDPDNPRARHRYETFGFDNTAADNVMALEL
ncbi:GNAT family N-acetyltransferase [Corynebacterium lipophiloflavum]|uniref:GNAT family N-acetyltransferase n=1 Tax=Corynebacterium lipophiloflavum TaxID=161889 RepID=UPI003CCB0BA8